MIHRTYFVVVNVLWRVVLVWHLLLFPLLLIIRAICDRLLLMLVLVHVVVVEGLGHTLWQIIFIISQICRNVRWSKRRWKVSTVIFDIVVVCMIVASIRPWNGSCFIEFHIKWRCNNWCFVILIILFSFDWLLLLKVLLCMRSLLVRLLGIHAGATSNL